MPAPKVYTAAMSSCAQLGDLALEADDGLDVPFTVERYGSLEACATLSRSFQTTFGAMRARERRQTQARIQRDTERPWMLDQFTHGKYDKLICQRSQLPNGEGWIISLIPQHVLLNGLDVIDRKSGKSVQEVGRGRSERDVLIEKHVRSMKANDPQMVTKAEYERFKLVDPEAFDLMPDIWGPHYGTKAKDVANIDLDEAGFGGEPEHVPPVD